MPSAAVSMIGSSKLAAAAVGTHRCQAGGGAPSLYGRQRAAARALPHSLMTDDGMWRIWLFQVCHLVLGQGDREGADGSFQMGDLRCPDDGRRHRLLL